MEALIYVELDIPYCALTYGIAPCQASLSSESQNDAFTMALLEFDGTDASTTITDDAAGTSNTWTASGNAQLDTAQFKFGTSSLLLDGAGDYVSTPDNAAFTLGSGDFTVDFWFRVNDAGGGFVAPCGQVDAAGGAGNTAWYFEKQSSNVITFKVSDGGVITPVTGTTAFTNAINTGWHHAAGVRTGNTLKLFIDGVQEGGDVAFAGAVANSTAALTVGRPGEFNGEYWVGWTDAFRLSVGVARWTSNFTPPTVAFSSAVVGTGDRKCFNSLGTCQDRENFLDQGLPGSSPYNPTTLRFAVDTRYLPEDIWCLPFIDDASDVEVTAAIVSLGENLGQRATVKVRMRDSRYSDTGPGGDKYLSERPYDPFHQGSFWGKFRARHPFLKGRNLRVISGIVGQNLEDMEKRYFVVESVNGPNLEGEFEIIAKDALKYADGDRAQAPVLNNGFLVSDITASALNVFLSPAGIGSEYAETGYATIGGNEAVQFWRDASAANDAGVTCKLLIHCDGTLSIFTDAAQGRTVTRGSAAFIDTNTIFVDSCVLFDATVNSFLSISDNADWTPLANFTWEMWAKFSNLSGGRVIFGHRTDGSNEQRLWVKATGEIEYSVIGASTITVTSAAGAVVVGNVYHVALVRNGNNFNIYLNGTSVASTVDADAIPNFTGSLNFGMRSDATMVMSGNLDEIALFHIARYTANFTPPAVPFLTSIDEVQISRGKFNTVAVAHEAEDRFQQGVNYDAEDAADIIYDQFVNYASP